MIINLSPHKVIHQASSELQKYISNLEHWAKWSPWSHIEPTALHKTLGSPNSAGHSLEWKGDIIGAGKMTLAKIEQNQIEYHLDFFAPFKNTASAVFKLQPINETQTTVTWHLTTSLPFFLFFLKNAFTAFMTDDLDRGLNNLKQIVETGLLPSRSTFIGERAQKEFIVVGKRAQCGLAEIGKTVRQICEELNLAEKEGRISKPGGLITLSHKHDIHRKTFDLTTGFYFFPEDKPIFPKSLDQIIVPAHLALNVDHYGTYQNLRNPWAMLTSHQRVLKKKPLAKVPPYEIYKTHPGQVSDSDILTQLFLPIKG